jgi:DNA polymerase IIIc chi subunit
MKKYSQFILEEVDAPKRPVVMAFGRMNPPTTGHKVLIDKVHELAKKHGAHHQVILSKSQDKKKNPLDSKTKVKHAKRFFPHTNIHAATANEPTLIHHAARLNKAGHDHLIMVAGSDRVNEYHKLLHSYNGKPDKKGHIPFSFKKIDVVSAGHRDPDAEGAEGMSASKMREHAKKNNFKEFKKGIPEHVSHEHAKELFHDVRKHMGHE